MGGKRRIEVFPDPDRPGQPPRNPLVETHGYQPGHGDAGPGDDHILSLLYSFQEAGKLGLGLMNVHDPHALKIE